MYNETTGVERVLDHAGIIDMMSQTVDSLTKDTESEDIKTAFLYFIASISKKAAHLITEELCLKAVKDHLNFHKKLLTLNLPLNE